MIPAISTAIYLVVVAWPPSAGGTHAIVVQEMPTMQLCESIGEQIAGAARGRIDWTCIEGAR
ncbi:MAG: hypothetical protein AB7U62_17720 [Pseudolabrys sp.]